MLCSSKCTTPWLSGSCAAGDNRDGQVLCSHQGTERTKEHFNIFLEYVPGGSIASLLAKFGEHHLVPHLEAPACAGLTARSH